MDLLKLIWVKNYNGLDFNLSAMPFSGEVKIMAKLAVLLVNLGSPEKPEVKSVRSYLDQFLMDPYVIQLPWWLRRLLVSLFVLPTRPKSSAKAYQSVWLSSGSPLIVISNRLKEQLQKQLNRPVEMAMRYGQPSIEKQILMLKESKGIEEIRFIPLYPHFAQSTVTTSVREAQRVINKHKLNIKLSVIEPFYEHPAYITALVNSARPYLEKPFDHIVFSYHGLPESHITKLDVSGQHCLRQTDCCHTESSFHKSCYRHQVFRTTERFVAVAELLPEQYSVAFQSRLGRAKWLGPNTEDRLRELATEGCKKVLVICPAFVTDCLETLEEIAIRGEDIFKEAGGDSLTLIPCLNDRPEWVQVLKSWSS